MTEQKQLTLNMEFLWSFCVRGRDGFRCQLYQKDHLKCAGVLQGAHIVTRNVKGIKFVLSNGLCLCNTHHKYYTHRDGPWSAIVMENWPGLWERLNDKKWLELNYAIDRDEIFAALLAEAQKYKWQFVEYLPKLQTIEAWAENLPRLRPGAQTKKT
jgi:hypothetical protein